MLNQSLRLHTERRHPPLARQRAGGNSFTIARHRTRLVSVLGAGLCLALAACGDSKQIGDAGFVNGFIGGVAADEPRAAIVGRDILSRGGTAADAATAMFFTLTVTKPSMASLGAVGGCVYYAAKPKEFMAYDFMPPASTPSTSGRPKVAPPAAVRGMAAMQARYGRMPWAELVGPAEALARFGHAVSRSLAADIDARAGELAKSPSMVAIFGRAGGGFVKEGDQIQQLELAATLSQVRQRGAGALFSGALARRYADAVATIGGDLPLAALRAYTPRALPALERPAGDHVIAFLPMANSNGPQQARLWRLLAENRALPRANRDERLHVIAEASVAAHADFAAWARRPGADLETMDDSAVNSVEHRFSAFNSKKAQPLSAWLGGIKPIPSEVSGTSVVAVDSQGNAAACGFTLFRVFGAGRMLPGIGAPPALTPPLGVLAGAVGPFVVGNKHTGNFFLALAGSGAGSSTTLVTIATELLLGDEQINPAIGAPRFSRSGGAATVIVEKDVGQSARAALQARGYSVEEGPSIGLVNGAYCPKGLPRDNEFCDIRTDWRGNGLAASAR